MASDIQDNFLFAHKTNIDCPRMSAFGGKADIRFSAALPIGEALLLLVLFVLRLV